MCNNEMSVWVSVKWGLTVLRFIIEYLLTIYCSLFLFPCEKKKKGEKMAF